MINKEYDHTKFDEILHTLCSYKYLIIYRTTESLPSPHLKSQWLSTVNIMLFRILKIKGECPYEMIY